MALSYLLSFPRRLSDLVELRLEVLLVVPDGVEQLDDALRRQLGEHLLAVPVQDRRLHSADRVQLFSLQTFLKSKQGIEN